MSESDFILPLKFYNTSDKEGTTYILRFKCKHILLCQVTTHFNRNTLYREN